MRTPIKTGHWDRRESSSGQRWQSGLAILFIVLFVGCEPNRADLSATATTDQSREHGHAHDEEDHNHEHDHVIVAHKPKNLRDAISKLTVWNSAIASALKKGDRDSAANTASELLDQIRWLPEVAGDSDMLEDDWNEVHLLAHRLDRQLSGLPNQISGSQANGDRAFEFADTSRTIEQAIATLKLIADRQPALHSTNHAQPE